MKIFPVHCLEPILKIFGVLIALFLPVFDLIQILANVGPVKLLIG